LLRNKNGSFEVFLGTLRLNEVKTPQNLTSVNRKKQQSSHYLVSKKQALGYYRRRVQT